MDLNNARFELHVMQMPPRVEDSGEVREVYKLELNSHVIELPLEGKGPFTTSDTYSKKLMSLLTKHDECSNTFSMPGCCSRMFKDLREIT